MAIVIPLTYEEFCGKYRETFDRMTSYTPTQIGSAHYCELLADLADACPAWLERFEAEIDDAWRVARMTEGR